MRFGGLAIGRSAITKDFFKTEKKAKDTGNSWSMLLARLAGTFKPGLNPASTFPHCVGDLIDDGLDQVGQN